MFLCCMVFWDFQNFFVEYILKCTQYILKCTQYILKWVTHIKLTINQIVEFKKWFSVTQVKLEWLMWLFFTWCLFYFYLILCMLSNFFMLFLSSADFFSKWTFSKNELFQNIIIVSNSLDLEQDRQCVNSDLELSCLQRLSADDKRKMLQSTENVKW